MPACEQLHSSTGGSNTAFVLVAGNVHLTRSRQNSRTKSPKALCGQILTGSEQRGVIDLDDAANLHSMNVCKSCRLKFQKAGHHASALVAAAALAVSAGLVKKKLEGQLHLFEG